MFAFIIIVLSLGQHLCMFFELRDKSEAIAHAYSLLSLDVAITVIYTPHTYRCVSQFSM